MRDLAFEAVVHFLRKYGLPAMLTFDRDSRWVGSASRRDFRIAPCAASCVSLDIEPNVCPREPTRQESVCGEIS